MRCAIFCIAAFVFWGALAQAADVNVPRVLDERLKIELFAAAPQIVTPTGIAVDARGRVLVIESHTHFRPKDYQGPAADRIRMFEDTDGDGRADRVTTFFEGTRHTMNLAIYRDGSVFVATRNEVFRLFDTDGDGKSDRRVSIAKLDTLGDYPHNGLSGFAFDAAGNVYFSFGENLGADYRLVGSDGRTLSGGGEGGNIYRCRADGSGLEQIATGFWNPFHLCLDAYERLFAVDNDPDWRPPCRLLHIVPGGDYGYRFRNGRRGLHPFTSWFGELPGTLPLVAGTGEAPSGVLAYESDNLPADYRGDLLATSWGFHAIQRYRMQPRGASFQSAAETIIKGDQQFRPVGIALAPDGSLYVSDWGDRSYHVHGKGRIWRISAVKEPKLTRAVDPRKAIHSPHGPLRRQSARRLAVQGDEGREHLRRLATRAKAAKVRAAATAALAAVGGLRDATARAALRDTSADVRALAVRLVPANILKPVEIAAADKSPLVQAAALRRIRSKDGLAVVLRAAADRDPFVRQAARGAIKRTTDTAQWLDSGLPKQADARLAVALVLRDRGDPAAEKFLPKLLADADSRVRFVAVQWVGEAKLKRFRPQLLAGLKSGAAGGESFAAYLAAIDLLDGGRGAAFEKRQADLIAGLLAKSGHIAKMRVRINGRLTTVYGVQEAVDALKERMSMPSDAAVPTGAAS
ncbi:MAG: hypothetical protein IIA67_05940 [Planctomycetes bacterium]|nr:hypothetical protein [Planctomycetota bacterium]